MEYFDYFPSRVYRAERPDLAQQVSSVCNLHLNQVRNNATAFCQTKNLDKELELIPLSDYLLLSAGNILREQGYTVEKYDFYVSGLWAQELKRGGNTDIHAHRNSQISGWIFLEVANPSISAVYHDTRINKEMIELDFKQENDIEFATNAVYFNNMISGTVLFSNSWMKHQLLSSDSDQPTTCIHFTISHRNILCNTY